MTPSVIQYTLNYSDGSGPKVQMTLYSNSRRIEFKQHDAEIWLDLEDVEWFGEAYENIAECADSLLGADHGNEA